MITKRDMRALRYSLYHIRLLNGRLIEFPVRFLGVDPERMEKREFISGIRCHTRPGEGPNPRYWAARRRWRIRHYAHKQERGGY